MKTRGWFIVGAILAVAVGCGDDDDGALSTPGGGGAGGGSAGTGGQTAGSGGATGGSGGGVAGASCEAACARINEANCPNEQSEAECITSCEGNLTNFPGCEAELGGYVNCVATRATITCDLQTGSAVSSGCDAEEQAFISCGACLANSSDDACTACSKQQCCDGLRALAADPNFVDFMSCFTDCTDLACREACGSTYPSTYSLFVAEAQCVATNCATECS